MHLDIDDKSLEGFNAPAKASLKKATLQFAEDLMKESNRIEASRNPASGDPQVTSSMVDDANVLVRRGLARPRKIIGVKLLRIVAAVLSLIVGFTYDAAKLQDKTYMLIFVILVAVTIIAVTISIILE